MKEKKKIRTVSLSGPDQPGSSSVVNTDDVRSENDDQAVPFILVDCTALADRSDLDAALSQVERERMERVEEDIDGQHVPQLEDVEPPPELDMPINLGSRELARLKAAEDERRFQEDLRNLSIFERDEDEKVTSNTTKSISELALNEGKLLLQTTYNLDQIRIKLEQLRDLQEQILSAETNPPQVVAPSPIPERPSICRQGTFDIKRDREKKGDQPVCKVHTTRSLSRALPNTRREKVKSTLMAKTPSCDTLRKGEGAKISSGTQQIISQIGDLLMKLQIQRGGCSNLDEGSSYSYVVTIKPAEGVSNCSVHAITDPKSRQMKATVQPRISHQAINIFSPANGTPELRLSSSYVYENLLPPMSRPESQSTRLKAPILRKRPCPYLKVPTPASYCHGMKRD
ncbi:uncharacterized protein LOC128264228 [Drosophila gunungcola]|uniref:uncharacterized protein LOC128264228 n=1 Tax=Drosophila gunungcola TaxID=103775 RepID=UPI0022DF7986|nr:uncharacterized protein LOC128264228 [Drosophila gunungcola]XP_052855583.1 uncharacterized protein LOC128264228 [Drosophila gunungcola]